MLAQKLKKLLSEKGISKPSLAEKVKVAPEVIEQISMGKYPTEPNLLNKIAQALEVDLVDLYCTPEPINIKPIYVEKRGYYIKVGELKTRMFN